MSEKRKLKRKKEGEKNVKYYLFCVLVLFCVYFYLHI